MTLFKEKITILFVNISAVEISIIHEWQITDMVCLSYGMLKFDFNKQRVNQSIF